MGRIITVLLATLLLAGCSSDTGDPAVDKFVDDVGDQGIASSLVEVGGDNLGKDVCNDIRSGQAAPNVLISVADGPNQSMRSASIITYYAITDICPDQISQRQDHWRDGT